MQGGAMRHLKFKAAADLIDQNEILITYQPPRPSDPNCELRRSGLTQKQLDKLNWQLRWVEEIYRRIPEHPCSQSAIADQIRPIAEHTKELHIPGVSTIAAWMKRWIRGGRLDTALMPRIKPSRVDHGKLDPDVLSFINSSIQAVYLTRQRNPMSAVYSDVQMQVANYNAMATAKLVMPSKEIVRRIINLIDGYERDQRRHGKHYARRKHHAAGRSFVAREPLEMCMADGQIMDIIVLEEPRDDGLPQEALGRPYMTVIIDVRTRCVLAAYISLAPFSGGTLLKTMSIAITAARGLPRGIMTTLVVDNGSDYLDSGFARLCANLDIQLEPCPPRMPNGKAIVERFFRTISEDLVHKLPGSTFSNPTDRGDYNSQKYARLTLRDLRRHVDTWVNEIYHQRPHRSLGRAPMAVWNDEVQA
jgi:putative transposase